jgi:hypothetical protein
MTAKQREALKGQDLDAEINEKLAMIRDGEEQVKVLKAEADRLSIIITQRRMNEDVLEQHQEAFLAAVNMFAVHYRHEIRTGQHQSKSVGALLKKYLGRERNLMRWPGWRFALARWLTRPWIDQDPHIYNQTTSKPAQIQEDDNG